jgi:hypothetical protein
MIESEAGEEMNETEQLGCFLFQQYLFAVLFTSHFETSNLLLCNLRLKMIKEESNN